MKKDFALELHQLISESLDRVIEEKKKPLFNTSCRYFSRIGKSNRPFCQKGNNREILIKTKTGPYQGWIANCRDCDQNEELKK